MSGRRNTHRDERPSPRQYRNPYTESSRPGRSNREWRHDLHEAVDQEPTRHLQIRNLHYEVTEAELGGLFDKIGPVESGPRIEFDRSGRSLGKATVSMSYVQDAETAIAEFSGAKAKGQTIYVDFAPNARKAPRTSRGRSRSPDRRLNNGHGDGLGSRLAGPDLGSRLSSRDEDRRTLRQRFNRDDAYDHDDDRGRRGRRDPRAERGGRTVRGVGARGRGGRTARGGRERRLPKTVDDLDAELDAFMKAPAVERESKQAATDAAASNSTEEPIAPPAPPAPPAPSAAPAEPMAAQTPAQTGAMEDVEMEL